MPATKVELNIAEQAIAQVMTDRLNAMMKTPDDWDTEDFEYSLKLLSKKDGVKKLAIDFLKRQEEYPPEKILGDDFPFAQAVMKQVWKTIDWAKVEEALAGVVGKFIGVALLEIKKRE